MSPAATTKKTTKNGSSNKRSKKFPVERLAELIKSERSEVIDPQTVFGLLPMRVYQHIADIGCGPGYFSIPLAKYAFDGRIYAVDVQQEMLDAVDERAKEVRLSNVELLLSTESKIPMVPAARGFKRFPWSMRHPKNFWPLPDRCWDLAKTRIPTRVSRSRLIHIPIGCL